MSSYLPVRSAELHAWLVNFSDLVTAAPLAYGLTAEQGVELAHRFGRYNVNYGKSQQPSQRTTEVVQDTATSRKTLVAYVRKLVGIIQDQPGTTDGQRAALGITIKDAPSPIPVPSKAPVLEVAEVVGWTVKLQLGESKGNRRKPAGVKGANIFSFVGEQPPAALSAWKFEGGTTRSTATLEFDHTLPPGTKLWLTAFWFNPRLQSGPACAPVATQVNYGGLSQAA